MKNLKDCFINIDESRQIEYRVSLVGCHNEDNDGLPVDVTILVDSVDKHAFIEYLEREQDNVFAHVSGPGIEY